MRPTGIEVANAYCGMARINVSELFEHRSLDAGQYGSHMMLEKTVPLPCEDIVTYAVNAAAPVVNQLPADRRTSIGTLIVATESPLDFSKSVSTWVHDLLGLPRNCRLLEVKQGAFAGIGALQMAAAMVASSSVETRVLVIAGDVPHRTVQTLIEPSQGAGAVAALVGPEPQILSLEPGLSGCYSYEIQDFFRPGVDVDITDFDLSVMSYVDCLFGAVRNFQRRVPGSDLATSFDQLAMHTPCPGMPVSAYRAVMRRLAAAPQPDDVAADAVRLIYPSIRYAQAVGNIQAGATLLAILSAIQYSCIDDEYNLGVFSYGSGCSSEFLGGRVLAGARELLARAAVATRFADRRLLTMAEYDSVVSRLPLTGIGVTTALLDLSEFADIVVGEPRLLMSGIDHYRRTYTWSEGSQ